MDKYGPTFDPASVHAPGPDYAKPWFLLRGPEGHYCNLCRSWATAEHVSSDRHKKNEQWYAHIYYPGRAPPTPPPPTTPVPAPLPPPPQGAGGAPQADLAKPPAATDAEAKPPAASVAPAQPPADPAGDAMQKSREEKSPGDEGCCVRGCQSGSGQRARTAWSLCAGTTLIRAARTRMCQTPGWERRRTRKRFTPSSRKHSLRSLRATTPQQGTASQTCSAGWPWRRRSP